MSSRKLVALAVALTAVFGAGVAQARGNDDVQWSVTVGTPVGVPVYGQAVPIYSQTAPVYQDYSTGRHYRHETQYREPRRWDVDGDGIPNRYDRVYNPVWDQNGNGVPDRREYRHQRDDWRYRHDGWGR